MDTVITRDSDIVREYIAVLDGRSRGLSPFARFACITKLAGLRRELEITNLETTDEDIAKLRKEIDQQLTGGFLRGMVSGRWGSRLTAFLVLTVGGQLALLLALAVTTAFVTFVPTPGWWNRALPHDDPAFIVLFAFTFFFAVPMLSVLLVCGGRFFHSWRLTVPATIVLIAGSAGGTALVMTGKPNPVLRQASWKQFAAERALSASGYEQWLNGKWLLKDPKFRADYERYLRNGPGRWITARIGSGDASWQGSLRVMNEYLDGGEDPNGLRDWLKYYLDRNRIYSPERIDQEVRALTADQRYLGVWEVEPFLKERDVRTYRAYLASIRRSMKIWGLLEMAVLIVIFLAGYFLAPVFNKLAKGGSGLALNANDSRSGASAGGSYYPFPERAEITTPPFFETPFRVLGRVHRGFLRLTVFTSVFVFALLGVIYASGISSNEHGPSSLISLQRGFIIFAGGNDNIPADDTLAAAKGVGADLTSAGVPAGALVAGSSSERDRALGARIAEIEQRQDDSDYDTSKKLDTQQKLLAAQSAEIQSLRGQTSELQQTTSPLTQQVNDLSSRTGAVEERAAQALGDASAVKQQVDSTDKRLSGKIDEVDAKATRASEDADRAGEAASTLATRADALEKELDRRAHQIEAQTLELGKRTNTLKEGQDELGLSQQAALNAIIAGIAADTDELDHQTQSVFYRLFSKKDARQRVGALINRLRQLRLGLIATKSKNSQAYIGQIANLIGRVEEIGKRVK